MGNKDWETPPDFFRKVHGVYNFTLDAAASDENALLDQYCTLEGKHSWTPKDPFGFKPRYGSFAAGLDGLNPEAWRDERVWCNPPYDSTLYKWVEIAASGIAEVAVLLLPPSIDTKWFHDFIWDDGFIGQPPGPRPGVEIHFLKKRLKFWYNGKEGKAPRGGSMLVVFNKKPLAFN